MKKLQALHYYLSESHMAEVLQSLNTIPWTFDFQQNMIISDLSYIDVKYTGGKLVSQQSFESFVETILPEYREEIISIYSRVKNGMIARSCIQMQIRMGKRRKPLWVELNIAAEEKDKQGMVVRAVGCTTIIQKRKEAEQMMLKAQKKAEQANMIKTNFLANMTHEFRTPLNSILGFSTIMAHCDTIEERMQCLGAIQTSGTQLVQIIDDVIELSKLEANEVELHNNLVNINDLLAKTVDEMMPMRKPGVTMAYHHTEANIILHGDDTKIALVMKQLLDNSCKYTEHGTIDVYCHKSSEHAVITVKDTGIGMTQEHIKHMFERFYKVNSFASGTGLGMSIVKGLVRLWDGTIKVDSRPGEGTSITFTIPLHASFYQNRTLQQMAHPL